jgi:hypothetical protein
MSDNDRDQDLSRYPPPQVPPHNQPQQHGPWQHQKPAGGTEEPAGGPHRLVLHPGARLAPERVGDQGHRLHGHLLRQLGLLLAAVRVPHRVPVLPVCFVVWIWGMVDAYQGAQRWNARYGIIS